MLLEFVVFGVGLTGAFVGLIAYRRHRAKRAWGAFAADHELSSDLPSIPIDQFEMHGQFRGEDVRVHTKHPNRRQHQNVYTVYSVTLPDSVPMDLAMYDETLFGKLGKMFGTEDIEVGHPDLDDSFIIKGDKPTKIREFLNRETVADALLSVHELCSNVTLEHGSLRIEQHSLADHPETLETHLETLVRCAKVLKNASEANAIGTMETYESESADAPAPQKDHVAEW